MIYTVTLNPALDYVVHLEQFAIGATNRTTGEAFFAGGKGINVSIVLNHLGVKSVALGFLAGFTGEVIERWLAKRGIAADFVTIPLGMTRINIKLKTGTETEINGMGPDIDVPSLQQLYVRLDALREGDTLVLSGSAPQSLPTDIYGRVLARLEGRNVRCVVDAVGPLAEQVLPYRPFLIKPNHAELGALCRCRLDPWDLERIEHCARQLQDKGARNVLVSMGDMGALLAAEDGRVYFQPAAKGELRNSVGSGDAMVAGFLAALEENGADFPAALRLAAAAGGATAFSPALATLEEINAVLATLE